ncbi:DEKNAAC103560 [Brettanomyces naardenensis]|uniref:DEKNAAC103560 n=1 Tax=Brettanomyces naardenensis TaxID=13370 RepID=A0A448YNI0_BRENA|nr:DEKNAAC103560 [Brettanomyces naardenensis]
MKQVELSFFSPDRTPKKRPNEEDRGEGDSKRVKASEGSETGTNGERKQLVTPPIEIIRSADDDDVEEKDEEVERNGVEDRTGDGAGNKESDLKIVQTGEPHKIDERKLKKQKEVEEKRLVKAEEKRIKKAQLEEEKRVKKEKLEEEKRIRKEKLEEEKRIKREKLEEEKRIKREKLEEEKRIKKELLEEEKKLKKEQREKEKIERQKKKEEDKQKRKAEQDEKKRLKEEECERQKEADEERKRKHSIMNFFHVKTTNVKKTAPTVVSVVENSSATKAEEAKERSDYESFFLPFYVKPNTRLAQQNPERSQFTALNEFLSGKAKVKESFEDYLRNCKDDELLEVETADEVTHKMNLGMIKESQEEFKKVPKKFLQFYENLKAPYCGTYSYSVFDVNEKIATDPFVRVTSTKDLNVNYDYDSDLEDPEDEEDGEGIDLDDEDDEDEDDDEDASGDSSDIDEFVEKDSNNSQASKQKILGPLKPETRWMGEEVTEEDVFGKYFESLGYERLRYSISFPIDPFNDYWKEATVPSKTADTVEPLADGNSTPGTSVVEPMTVKKKIITDTADLRKLIGFILNNRDYTLNTLTELMQKQVLSQYPRSVVKNSIRHFASFNKKQNVWIVNVHEDVSVV